ncbi:MAG: YwmB family TATA-box binding protein [Clostridia bacterium]|nr:YwmB family TATA-box binding protein [Clostridia bacterium]
MFVFWKRFFSTLLAVIIALAICFAVMIVGVCKLGSLQGERTFYLYSASSQAKTTKTLGLSDVFHVQGESVHFALLKSMSANEKQEYAEKIAKTFGAEILFLEEVNGVVCFYAYTPKWTDCVRVEEWEINLHIALGETGGAVGTPLIFGGF